VLKNNCRALCRDVLPFYLLHAGPISYTQSASVWHMLQTAPAGKPDRTALGVYRINYQAAQPSGPGYDQAAGLCFEYPDLARTSRIRQVLDAFGAEMEVALHLSAWDDNDNAWPPERQSNEANFKRLLEEHRARYLIFAGHGVYNDKYPQFSGIIFNMCDPVGQAPLRRRAKQDGFFGLKDIFQIEMPDTELTFLAACQGGLGGLSRGEGVNALTRAFMYRGSPAVIASLWSVDEGSTIDLVEAFFGALRAQPDADKAELLQAAKQALAEGGNVEGGYAHPYFWAPFVLMGQRSRFFT
jgi:hypothetical protein